MRENRRRLVADIPEDLFKAVKISAINRNCTLTKWVIRALTKQLNKENTKSTIS